MSSDDAHLLIPAEFYFQSRCEVAFNNKLRATIASGKHPTGMTTLPDLGFRDTPEALSAEVSCGWSDDGLAFDFIVHGRSAPRSVQSESNPDEDFLSVYIDTRDTKSNRRANRFCHLFYLFRPAEANPQQPFSGIQLDLPHSNQQINENLGEDLLISYSSQKNSYYRVSAWIDRQILHGYDPANVPSLGFFYHLREIGGREACFGIGSEFPFDSDPSLWPSLDLIR